jgi:hypothetical protein
VCGTDNVVVHVHNTLFLRSATAATRVSNELTVLICMLIALCWMKLHLSVHAKSANTRLCSSSSLRTCSRSLITLSQCALLLKDPGLARREPFSRSCGSPNMADTEEQPPVSSSINPRQPSLAWPLAPCAASSCAVCSMRDPNLCFWLAGALAALLFLRQLLQSA